MDNCEGRATWPAKPWSIAILDNDSVYFTAVSRVLTARGWPIVKITIEPDSTATLVKQIRAQKPDILVIGEWNYTQLGTPVIQQLLDEQLHGSILVVSDGNHPCDGEMILKEVQQYKSLIDCTTAAFDSFLRAASANLATTCPQ